MAAKAALTVAGLCKIVGFRLTWCTIRKMRHTLLSSIVVLASCAALAQTTPTAPLSLNQVHKIFIEKMGGDLDQYLRAEFIKQAKGRLVVVLVSCI
jgi:hypothetical protein